MAEPVVDHCGYLWPEDFDPDDEPVANHQSCCWRETWKDNDHCIWHAETDEQKPPEELEKVRETAESQELNYASKTPAELLDGVNLVRVDLTDAGAFTGCSLRDSILTDSDLSKAHLWETSLTNARLTSANLTGATLMSADLTDANLQDTTLTNADLRDAILTNANLGGPTLADADRQGATLSDADLRKATLTNANFMSVDFTNTNLVGADLTGVSLQDAVLTDADLRSATLTNAKLVGADLNDADLRSATLTEADLEVADLTDSNLRIATLTDASLRNATLTGANLQRAVLSRTNLREATLRRIKCSEINVKDVVMDGQTTVTISDYGEPDHDGIARGAHALRGAAIDNGLRPVARRLRYRERVERRREAYSNHFWLMWIRSWIATLVTGYGVYISRIAVTMVMSTLLFAGVYWALGMADPIQLSIEAFIPGGIGEPTPIAAAPVARVESYIPGWIDTPSSTDVAHYLILAEAFIGTVLTVLISYVLVTRDSP